MRYYLNAAGSLPQTPDDFRQLANLGTACRGVTTTHE